MPVISHIWKWFVIKNTSDFAFSAVNFTLKYLSEAFMLPQQFSNLSHKEIENLQFSILVSCTSHLFYIFFLPFSISNTANSHLLPSLCWMHYVYDSVCDWAHWVWGRRELGAERLNTELPARMMPLLQTEAIVLEKLLPKLFGSLEILFLNRSFPMTPGKLGCLDCTGKCTQLWKQRMICLCLSLSPGNQFFSS